MLNPDIVTGYLLRCNFNVVISLVRIQNKVIISMRFSIVGILLRLIYFNRFLSVEGFLNYKILEIPILLVSI